MPQEQQLSAAAFPQHPQLADQAIFTSDNLPVLRGIDSNSIDLIYLDPPFNSNRNYAAPIGSQAAGAHFKDRWTLDDLKIEEVGLLAETNEPLAELIRTAGQISGKGTQAYLTYMATRLLEMHRILKGTGVLLLHCDDTMHDWLSTCLRAIFGANNHINTIIWKRTTTKGTKRKLARVYDTVIAFAKDSTQYTFNQITDNTKQQQTTNRDYRYQDEHGQYASSDPSAPNHGTEKGNYLRPWRGIKPTQSSGSVWRGPPIQTFPPSARALLPPDFEQRDIHEKLDLLDGAKLIHWSKGGRPRHKRYLTEQVGSPREDLITDIKPVRPRQQEATGYPTQKPVALLNLLIQAFSNPGDYVLDPFCGCATTMIAAQDNGRRWCGIDLSELAVQIVRQRLRKENPLFTGKVVIRTDIPQRTDHAPPPTTDIRHILYGQQEGICNGCDTHFPFRNLTLDHIVPQSKGGSDHPENLQLLCAACNSTKGDRDMAYLRTQLKAQHRKP